MIGNSGIYEFTANSPNADKFSARVIWGEDYDVASNKSTPYVSLYCENNYYRGFTFYWIDGTISVNGTPVIEFNEHQGSHNVTLPYNQGFMPVLASSQAYKSAPWYSAPIEHDVYGAKSVEIAVNVRIRASQGELTARFQDARTVELYNIPRGAKITTAANFTDENNPTIGYSNPAGSAVDSLQACIAMRDIATDPVQYRDVPKTGTQYTFELTGQERAALCSHTPTNIRKAVFKIKTVIGGNTFFDTRDVTFTVSHPNPIMAPTVADTNPDTVALTGNSSVIVLNASTAHADSHAAAVKGSTLVSQQAQNGSTIVQSPGDISSPAYKDFWFTATDSRGNTTTAKLSPQIVPYVVPTVHLITQVTFQIDPETGAETNLVDIHLKISGQYYTGSFGTTQNELHTRYRYRLSGGEYGRYVEGAFVLTYGENSTYSGTAVISGLDYQSAYEVEASVSDKLTGWQADSRPVETVPVFDFGRSDFRFNVPVYVGRGLKCIYLVTETGFDEALEAEFEKIPYGATAPVMFKDPNAFEGTFHGFLSKAPGDNGLLIGWTYLGKQAFRARRNGSWQTWKIRDI